MDNYKLLRFNELNTGVNSHLAPVGPGEEYDFRYNPTISNSIISSNELDKITGTKEDIIEDDEYFNNNRKRKKRKKEDKIFKEGSGFGNTDYRNVTGNAGSFGYLNDNQPIGSSNTTLLTNIPRGDYHQPTTAIVRFKDFNVEDPYFNINQKKKRKSKSKYIKRMKDRKIKKLNKVIKGGLDLIFDSN
jgi:hypothetical protein